jgi:hypothetical protein
VVSGLFTPRPTRRRQPVRSLIAPRFVMPFCRAQMFHCSPKYEYLVRLMVSGDVRLGAVNEFTDLGADGLQPDGQAGDIRIDARVLPRGRLQASRVC